MLSVFPIMFLAPLAHFILRLFVGVVFVHLGLRHFGTHRHALREVMGIRYPSLAGFLTIYIATIELAVGLMLILGFLTQAAALVGAVTAIKFLILKKRFGPPVFPQPMVYVLLLGACLSLLVTGAGAFAFDLPI